MTIVELVSEAGADLEAKLGRDREVALVEEAMQVGAEEKPVGHLVRARAGVGSDVRGFQSDPVAAS